MKSIFPRCCAQQECNSRPLPTYDRTQGAVASLAVGTTLPDSDTATTAVGALDQHAGLEKWSLVNGTWQLDSVLTNGLIGVVDSNVAYICGAVDPRAGVCHSGAF